MEHYNVEQKIQEFMAKIEAKNPNEPEFIQAVKEVAVTVIPFIATKKEYTGMKLLERMAEPERVIIFRVPWIDDKGEIQVNRGFRIQMNSAIGPYKGGIRFHPTVNLSVLKFLAFEQVFKNSLTTLPMGGGKGGSDFDPQGKSDMEIMRFCQAFMTELCKHIGPETDVPAGDIGVGAREIGYLFGQYKKIRNEFTGVLTGKGLAYGGSLIRPEATGYGVVYFAEQMLKTINESIAGKTAVVSGFGNVAWGVIKKINDLGGKVVTISGPDGYIYDKDGISGEKIDYLLELRASGNNRAEDYAKKYPEAQLFAGKRPWDVKCDIA
ncbi:MAG: glutamate dehydrogenase, partial [Chryseobacterium sp.]|nr:glutamate dehydrogenase [Chryseobacterium sp.]